MLRLPQSVFFETYAFTNMFPDLIAKDRWSEYDYVGTLSWKAPLKFVRSFKFGPLEMDAVLGAAPPGADVIALVGQRDTANILNMTNRSHPRFSEVWTGLLEAYGNYTRAEIATDDMIPFYCNYWLAKPEYVVKFIPFMQKAHRLLSNLTTIQDALWSDAKYVSNTKVAQSVFGLDYYAYHPFVLERLTPFFFNVQKLNIFVYKKYKRVFNAPALENGDPDIWAKLLSMQDSARHRAGKSQVGRVESVLRSSHRAGNKSPPSVRKAPHPKLAPSKSHLHGRSRASGGRHNLQ